MALVLAQTERCSCRMLARVWLWTVGPGPYAEYLHFTRRSRGEFLTVGDSYRQRLQVAGRLFKPIKWLPIARWHNYCMLGYR